jgi:hypothetical protein
MTEMFHSILIIKNRFNFPYLKTLVTYILPSHQAPMFRTFTNYHSHFLHKHSAQTCVPFLRRTN